MIAQNIIALVERKKEVVQFLNRVFSGHFKELQNSRPNDQFSCFDALNVIQKTIGLSNMMHETNKMRS